MSSGTSPSTTCRFLQYLFADQPLAVSAHGVSHVLGNPENMAQVTLYYDAGMIAHLNVNWLAPVKVRQVLLGGSKKMIVYDDLQPSDKLKIYDRGLKLGSEPDELRQILVNYRMGDMWSPQLSTTEPLLVEADAFRRLHPDVRHAGDRRPPRLQRGRDPGGRDPVHASSRPSGRDDALEGGGMIPFLDLRAQHASPGAGA